MKRIGHWFAGCVRPGQSDRYAEVYDPATGQQTAEVALASAKEVDEAVRLGASAAQHWSEASLSARTRVLFAFRDLVYEHREELASAITDEHGKVIADALGEVERGLEVIEFACGAPHLLKGEYSDQISSSVDVFSYRQPLGVVVGITPFNFPVMVPLWMHPMAIACGNAFILKPSEKVPSASMIVGRLWTEAGLPDGVFTVINGDRVAVEALIDHPSVAAVSFVGSTAVARRVYARARSSGKRVQALGGAKNHAVVLPDADLNAAAAHVTAAGFGSAGQRCMAISAAVVLDSAADAFVDALTKTASAIRTGPGHDESSEMGPVISAEARARIAGYIERSANAGAEVALDGRGLHVAGHDEGFFIGPTIIDRVTPGMEIYRDEVFGPVLSLLRCKTVDVAIDLINANPYGNGTAIFTSSGALARRFHRNVRVGMVGINVPIPVPVASYSFGGWKDSLFGEHSIYGRDGVHFYTQGKVITARWPESIGTTDVSYHFPTSR